MPGEENIVQNSITNSPLISTVHKAILSTCDSFLTQAPVEHVKIGRRMLDKSRECPRKVFYPSYTYRMTHNELYFKRVEQELLVVSAFKDWNPSHFLAVVEMTMAATIGFTQVIRNITQRNQNSNQK